MANPYVNKVISNGVTKLDLTADTVTADKLVQGYTAHDASGQAIVGTMDDGYPLYIWDSQHVSPESYVGSYPTSPCFVYYIPNNGLYYCTDN